MVHQDAPHGDRRGAIEVAPVLDSDRAPAREVQVGFVDQGGRLQRVIGALAPQQAAGNALQLRIDDIQQLLERVGIALVPPIEESGYVAH